MEDWRKNIHKLTGDLKKQVKMLDEENGESHHEGRGDTRRDFFQTLVGKIQKDIEDLVRHCQRVLTLTMKKMAGGQEQNDQDGTPVRADI